MSRLWMIVAILVFPAVASSQTFADLGYAKLSTASLKSNVVTNDFSATDFWPSNTPCKDFSPAPLPGDPDSGVVARLSSQLATTDIFVPRLSAENHRCGDAREAPMLPLAKGMVASQLCTLGPLALAPMPFPNLSPVCLPPGMVFSRSSDIFHSPSLEVLKNVTGGPRPEPYHWGATLRESLEFLLFEHGFRLVDDPYLRYLLFHKPFWKDYLSSANQFDMSRWGDGDDFLVNYIGHPMQGGVTGNIYLQNDPRARGLRFGKSSEYWKSRMRAMLFSAVYSAYFEIGPIFSETAIGNEGGYTYTPGCGHYVCDRPGYKPPTNNTAWVDFIVTPTIGTGLLVLEDFIELKIVDPMVGDSQWGGYKILRAALYPTQSMANLLAPRHPWSRRFNDGDFQPGNFGGNVNPAMQTRTEAWKYEPRWTADFQYTNTVLHQDRLSCVQCPMYSSGFGSDVTYRLTNLLYADVEGNIFPAANGASRAEEVFAGVKIGRSFGRWGVYVNARPGFVHFDSTFVTGSQTDFTSSFRTALDTGGTIEYRTSPRSMIRFGVGTTLVRYLTGHPDPRQLPISVLSTDYIVTQGNLHLGTGYVFRF
jgi:hypothetical protein